MIFASLVCLLQESALAEIIELLVEEWLEFVIIDQILAVLDDRIGFSGRQIIFDYSYRVSVRISSIAIVFDAVVSERAHARCSAHKI